MGAAFVMQILHSLADLQAYIQPFRQFERPVQDIPFQAGAVHVFHNHNATFFVVVKIKNLHHICVLETFELGNALGKIPHMKPVAEEVFMEQFYGYRLIFLGVYGQIDPSRTSPRRVFSAGYNGRVMEYQVKIGNPPLFTFLIQSLLSNNTNSGASAHIRSRS